MINAEPSGAPLMCLGMSWPSNRHPPGSGLLPAISPSLPREVRVVGLIRSEEREVSRQEELTGLSRRRAARYICTLRCCSVTRCCLGRQSISSAHRAKKSTDHAAGKQRLPARQHVDQRGGLVDREWNTIAHKSGVRAQRACQIWRAACSRRDTLALQIKLSELILALEGGAQRASGGGEEVGQRTGEYRGRHPAACRPRLGRRIPRCGPASPRHSMRSKSSSR
jgi:hypothetical protein